MKMTLMACVLAVIGSRAYSQQSDYPAYKASPENIIRMHEAIKKFDELKKSGFFKKLPTAKQMDELSEALKPFQDLAYEISENEGGKLLDKMTGGGNGGNPNITGSDLQKAVSIHKRLLKIYDSEISVYKSWGEKYHQKKCVEEAEKSKGYYIERSEKWMATAPSLPFQTKLEGAYVIMYMIAGEDEGLTHITPFNLESGAESIVGTRLMAVCIGEKVKPFHYHRVWSQ